jgi:integrase
MFNYAFERDIVEINPCKGVKAPGEEQQRDRVLSEDEVRTFWFHLDSSKMDELSRLALKLQLVTAQRKGEVVRAEWTEFDLSIGWWTIPAEKSKNRLPHRVPLSPLAQTLLKQIKEKSNVSRWLFPSPAKSGHMTPGGIDNALRNNSEQINIPHFVPHDLRRTAASHMTSSGIPRLTVSKILNHAERGITSVYDRHSYDQEKRHALDAWARELERILTKDVASNVVQLRKG